MPAVTARACWPSATSAAGIGEPVPGIGPPSPSWPLPSAPQQRTAAPSMTAQAWVKPTVIPVAGPPNATGVMGEEVSLSGAPFPSCPAVSAPQQRTAPSASRTHEDPKPSASALAGPSRNSGVEGESASGPGIGPPLPTCP